MYCPSCGEEVDASDSFCRYCGGDLGREVTGDDVSTNRPAETPPYVESTGVMPPLVHLLGVFTWAVGALVVYLVAEDEFTRRNAAHALNWQLTYFVYLLVSVLLMVVLVGFLLFALLGLLNLVFCVVAAVKAADGEAWSYPFTVNFVSVPVTDTQI